MLRRVQPYVLAPVPRPDWPRSWRLPLSSPKPCKPVEPRDVQKELRRSLMVVSADGRSVTNRARHLLGDEFAVEIGRAAQMRDAKPPAVPGDDRKPSAVDAATEADWSWWTPDRDAMIRGMAERAISRFSRGMGGVGVADTFTAEDLAHEAMLWLSVHPEKTLGANDKLIAKLAGTQMSGFRKDGSAPPELLGRVMRQVGEREQPYGEPMDYARQVRTKDPTGDTAGTRAQGPTSRQSRHVTPAARQGQ